MKKPRFYSEYGVLDIDVIILLIVIIATLFLSFSLQQHVIADKLTCKSFLTQKAAQETFNSNPKRYKNLDRGGVIGKPCESLP